MFTDALRSMVEGTDGAIASLLMDAQGVPIERFSREGASIDIDVVGAEFTVVIGSVQRAIESLEAGGTREIAVTTDRVVTIIRVVSPGYYVALALEPGGNVGKGRFLMRTATPRLLAELG